MEAWARRIKSLLDEKGLSQTDLARACGRSQPSMSQWFSDTASKPATKMIMGDNLLAAARFLGTTPEYILTGEGRSTASQPTRPDFQKMASAVLLLRHYLDFAGSPADWISDPDMLDIAYEVVESFGGPVRSENVLDLTKALAKKIRGQDDAGQGSIRGTRKAAGGTN
ncbi:helix-turn-helix transcriptional regulator [Stenotrophomonas sp. 278]|uniref:helix-turn-helix domain-containing protein n=1 Tax=Stenotrophomonas sp. 278 TaxID=2479851 RepID=UPI000F66795C|nr:helix-turn-helix transcriptional regulator [Stenotrophomonas sp. 278]RRU17848.1 XRE family transcriptional regulator [Stenotrophomonas sp. 278]